MGPAFELKLINSVTELLRPAFLGGELVTEALEGAVGCPQLRILLLNYRPDLKEALLIARDDALTLSNLLDDLGLLGPLRLALVLQLLYHN